MLYKPSRALEAWRRLKEKENGPGEIHIKSVGARRVKAVSLHGRRGQNPMVQRMPHGISFCLLRMDLRLYGQTARFAHGKT